MRDTLTRMLAGITVATAVLLGFSLVLAVDGMSPTLARRVPTIVSDRPVRPQIARDSSASPLLASPLARIQDAVRTQRFTHAFVRTASRPRVQATGRVFGRPRVTTAAHRPFGPPVAKTAGIVMGVASATVPLRGAVSKQSSAGRRADDTEHASRGPKHSDSSREARRRASHGASEGDRVSAGTSEEHVKGTRDGDKHHERDKKPESRTDEKTDKTAEKRHADDEGNTDSSKRD